MMGRIISTVLSVVLMLTQYGRAADNPNIIIVYGDLGCYGETPDSQGPGKATNFRQCFCPKKNDLCYNRAGLGYLQKARSLRVVEHSEMKNVQEER